MTSHRSKLQDGIYFRVLRILQSSTDLTQSNISQLLGVSSSELNYCLNALIDKGRVKVQNFRESKIFGYVYLRTPIGIAEKAIHFGRYLQSKFLEFKALRSEVESLKDEAYSGSEVSPGT
jgi:EPS-associated MarR family transcriptional regulator